MAKGLNDFIKENASEGAKQFKSGTGAALGAVFMAEDLKNLATGEQRLKSIWNIVKNIVFAKPVMHAAFAGMFAALGKGVKSVLHDTGSLDAALRKLAKMQELQKVFAPLVGGAAQAKKRVAELANLAASRNLRFESVADAAKNLMVMSRGALGSAKDLDKLADMALVTGESITDLADVSARLHSTLREGMGISGVTEEMRAMSMISSVAAEKLTDLQRAGATMGQVLEEAAKAQDDFKAGLTGVTEEVKLVEEAYESAKKKMAEGFGSPWAQDDVERTKNLADAMNALAPTISAVSKFFSILFNGLSTTWSAVAKWAAESETLQKALRGLVYGLTTLIGVVSTVSGLKLAWWFIQAAGAANTTGKAVAGVTASMKAFGAQVIANNAANNTWTGSVKRAGGAAIQWAAGLTVVRVALVAVRVALLATGILALVSVITMLVGAFKGWRDSAKNAAKEMEDFMAEVNKSNASLRKQIGEVETLSQMNDKLAEALANVTQAQEEFDAAMRGGDKTEQEKARRKLGEAKKTGMAAISRAGGDFFMEDSEIQAQIEAAERGRQQKDQSYQERMSAASPEQQAAIRAEEIARLRREANIAEAGVAAEAGYSRAQKEADKAVGVAKLSGDENALAKAQADRSMIGITSETRNKPIDQLTSTEAMALYRTTRDQRYLIQHGIAKNREGALGATQSRIQSLEAEASQSRIAATEGYSQIGSASQLAGMGSEGVARDRESRKIRIAELRRQAAVAASRNDGAGIIAAANEIQSIAREAGISERAFAIDDIQRSAALQLGEAELRGDSKGARKIRNRMAVLDAFKSNLNAGMSREEAQNMAMRTMNQSMAIQARERFISAQGVTVADSLASIGGGGNVATSYATMEDLAEEQVDLLKDLKTSLDVIEMAVDNAKAIALE